MNETIFVILLATSLLCWIVVIAAEARVLFVLRRRHADFYRRLPTRKHSSTDDVYTPGWIKFQKWFLWDRGYATLHDLEVSALCRVIKMTGVVFAVLVAALFIQGVRAASFAT
jgi:hypothetical protein